MHRATCHPTACDVGEPAPPLGSSDFGPGSGEADGAGCQPHGCVRLCSQQHASQKPRCGATRVRRRMDGETQCGPSTRRPQEEGNLSPVTTWMNSEDIVLSGINPSPQD